MPEAAPDIEWVVLVPHEGVVPPEKLSGQVVVVKTSMRALLRPAWEAWRLSGALRQLGVDALLSPYGVVPPRCPVPTVSVVHDLAFLERPYLLPFRYRLYWRWMARSVERAARVVVPSTATQRVVIEKLGVDHGMIRRIAYASAAVFSPVSKENGAEVRRRFGVSGPFVLAVGTMEPRKNLRTLVVAMDGVNTGTNQEIPLVLVGRRGWGEGVAHRPWLHQITDADDHDLAGLYSEASVFAMPSLDEGFGLPALEAMACGAPVIVADAGALPEVVGRAGLTVPPEDVEGWTRALASVLGDRVTLLNMRRRSLDRAGEFSWTQSARALAEVLRGVGG